MKHIFTTMTAAAGICALLGSTAAARQYETGGARSDGAKAETRSDKDMPRSARTFIEEAAADSTAEVKLGELAKQKASNDDVKDFAERMVRDHSKAGEDLKQAAGQQNVTVSEQLKSKHQKTYDQLAKLSGDEFDREYIKHMVKDHEKAVKLFRKQADRQTDGEVSRFASSTLPTLEEHLSEAKRIQQELRGTGARGTSGTSDSRPSDRDDAAGTTGTRTPTSPQGTDDINDPGHSEPPPPAPSPEPAQRP